MADTLPTTPAGSSEPRLNSSPAERLRRRLQSGLDALDAVIDYEAALDAAASSAIYDRLLHRQELAFEAMDLDLRTVTNADSCCTADAGMQRLAYLCLQAVTGETLEEVATYTNAVADFVDERLFDSAGIGEELLVRAELLTARFAHAFNPADTPGMDAPAF